VVIGSRNQVVSIDHHAGGAVSVTLHFCNELACADRVHLNIAVVAADQDVTLFFPLIKIKNKYLIAIELLLVVFWNLGIIDHMT
jgi:non-homologous end joining protein Ku